VSGIKKVISLFTTVVFLFSVVASDLLAASMGVPAANISGNFQDIFQSKILIPNSYGKVTSISDMQSDTVIINIQDLHSHGDTQRNISKIIEVLDNSYNLNGVYVEGGVGNIDVSWIKQIENKELRDKLINNFVDEGDLTAGEYYYMIQDKEVALKGIENVSLHRDNIVRLANIESKKEQYEKIAKEINRNIRVLNKIYTNHRNIRFNKTLDEYLKGKISDVKLYAVISKYVKKINENPKRYNNITRIRMTDYPNIKFYMDMNELSSKTNMAKVSQELQLLLEQMKKRLPYSAYRQLQEYTESFSNTEKLIEVIGNYAEKENVDLRKDYRNLSTLIEINRAVNRLNPIELISEQRHLTERIRMALSYDNTEAEITYISDFKDYFNGYLTTSLPKEDWEYVKGRLDKFISIYEKYSGSQHLNEIKQDFPELTKYYEINTSRDYVFTTNLDIAYPPPPIRTELVENSPKTRPVAEILSSANEVKIMITGGYHSKGLQEILTAKGISAIVITPAVTSDIRAAHTKYNSTLKKQGKIFSESLACLIASSNTPLSQKALFIEASVRMFGINSPELSSIINTLKEAGANVVIQEDKITVSLSGETADIVLTGKETIPLKAVTQSIKEILNFATSPLANLFNTKNPLQNITDIEYEILKAISLTLFESDIYFSKDATKEVQQAGYLGKDLDGVKYDIYKYFSDAMQNLLLQKELSKTKDTRKQLSQPGTKDKWGIRGILSRTMEKIVRPMLSAFIKPVSHSAIKVISKESLQISVPNEITDTLLKNLVEIATDFGERYKSIEILKNITSIAGISAEDVLRRLIDYFKVSVEEHSKSYSSSYADDNIANYMKNHTDLAGIKAETVKNMPEYIQKLIYKRMIIDNEIANTLAYEGNDNFKKETLIKNYEMGYQTVNAVLTMLANDVVLLLENEGFTGFINPQMFEYLLLFHFTKGTGVSISSDNYSMIGVNIDRTDDRQRFFGVLVHELGHATLKHERISPIGLNMAILHEMYSYTLDVLVTGVHNSHNKKQMPVQHLMDVSMRNITSNDAHDMPRALHQLFVNVKGRKMDFFELAAVLTETKKIFADKDVSSLTPLELAYRIVSRLKSNKKFMNGLPKNSLKKVLDDIAEDYENTMKRAEERYKETLGDRYQLTLSEQELATFSEKTGKQLLLLLLYTPQIDWYDVFINELLQLQIMMSELGSIHDKTRFILDMKNLFNIVNNMDKGSPDFQKYSFTFRKEKDGQIVNGRELIYVDFNEVNNITRDKYSKVEQHFENLLRKRRDYAQTIANKAILPENQEYVNNLIMQGKSRLTMAAIIAFKSNEFFKSLNPKRFTLAHAQDEKTFKEAVKSNSAPLVVSLSGYVGFMATIMAGLLLNPFSLLLLATVTAVGILIGASVNIVTHIIIDYKYLKSSDLIEVVKQRGQAKVVNLKNYTVYVVNDMVDGEATGISIDGVPVRISRINDSIVISADGIEHERIVKAINNTKALKFAISNATGIKIDNAELSSITVDNNTERGVRFEDNLIKVGYKDLLDYASQDYTSFEKYAGGLSKIEREHRDAIIDKFIYLMDGDIRGAFEELLNQQDIPYVKLALSEKQYNDLVTNHRDIIEQSKAKEIEIFVVTEQSVWNDNFGFADGIIYDNKGNLVIYDYKTKEETNTLLVKSIDGNFNRKALEYDGMLLMDIAAIKEYSEGRDNLEINGLFKVMSGIMSALGEYTIGDISMRDIKKMLPGLVENIEIKDETLKEGIKEAVYNKNVTDFIKAMEEAQDGEAVIIYLKDASVSNEKKIAVMEQIDYLLFTAKIDVKYENAYMARPMQTYRSILSAA